MDHCIHFKEINAIGPRRQGNEAAIEWRDKRQLYADECS
jgi:hypothetical protein